MKTSTFWMIAALLFIAGCFYLGSSMFGGGSIGIFLMAAFIFYFADGFRRKT